jgi:hypothetical protein
MLQIYFLSIILNLIAGFALAGEYLAEKMQFARKPADWFIEDPLRYLITGAAAAVIGVLKIISVIKGDIAVVGDLLPALTGILLGSILLLLYYQKRSTVEEDGNPSGLKNFLLQNRSFFGIGGMLFSLVHFLFPRVLFL